MTNFKRISTALTFAAGTLFGCGAVLLPLSLASAAKSAAAAPQIRHHAPARVEEPSVAASQQRPAVESSGDEKTPRLKDHWELELQLD
jgi:hypothetical protein